jgi:hypothetical protein
MDTTQPKPAVRSRAIWGGWITAASAVLPIVLRIFGIETEVDSDQLATLGTHVLGAIDNVMAAVGIVLIVFGIRGAKVPLK